MRDVSPERLQALVDDEDLDGLLEVVTIDEVAEAWCCYTERREHSGPADDADDADPDWWAIEFFMMRTIFRNGPVYRSALLALLSRAKSDYLVSCVAAGPLEKFVSDDESDLRWLEQEAARMRSCLELSLESGAMDTSPKQTSPAWKGRLGRLFRDRGEEAD